MSYEYTRLRIDRNEHIAEVVLNQPERLNTMDDAFFQDIRHAFEEIDGDDTIRVAILWSEGRVFTAGLDLKAAATSGTLFADNGESQAAQVAALMDQIVDWQDCFSALENCSKPVIAAVHSHCIGGGVDLTTAADIRVCTKDATFGIHETKIAMVADVGTLQRITPIVGKGFAREMAYTGKRITADRAYDFHLVNEVYPDQEAMLEGARAMAAEIAANSPLAVQGAKRVLQFSEEHTVAEGLDFVAHWNASRIKSNDLMEAITAFMEKRDPTFTGT